MPRCVEGSATRLKCALLLPKRTWTTPLDPSTQLRSGSRYLRNPTRDPSGSNAIAHSRLLARLAAAAWLIAAIKAGRGEGAGGKRQPSPSPFEGVSLHARLLKSG